MQMRIKNTAITTKILSWVQIIGGIYGLGLIVWLLLKTQTINGPILLIFLTGLSLFIFSIVSGRYLLNSSKLKLGLILTLINFCLQLVDFKVNGYGLTYCAGINLTIGVDNGFKLGFGLINSIFNMSINSDDAEFVLKLNISAIFIIWLTSDIYDEIFGKRVDNNELS